MPELPEVETLKLGLQKYIIGEKIVDVTIHDPKVVEGSVKEVIGSTIQNIRRLAKGILIDLDNSYTIAFHIKLTGQLIYRDEKTKDMLVMKPTPATVPNKFTRVTFKLSLPHPNPLLKGEGIKENSSSPVHTGEDKGEGDSLLYFQEVRGFAWMKIVKTEDVQSLSFFKTLGPELIPSPGTHTPLLTLEMFELIISKSNLPIKVLLMEQKKIGGIGNIYANDGLFDAAIDPRRRAKSLTSDETKTLYDSLMKVLEKGMKYRGSSELNFVDVLGQQGEYQKHFLIYGKKGKKCERCGSTIQKIYLGGRGTFFCPGCQK